MPEAQLKPKLPRGWKAITETRIVAYQGPCLCGCGELVLAGQDGHRIDRRYVDPSHKLRGHRKGVVARR